MSSGGPTADLASPRVQAAVTELLRDAVGHGAALGWVDPPPTDEVVALLSDLARARHAGDADVVLAWDGPALTGFGYWRRYARPTHRPHADLERIVVDPAHQRQGVGRGLLRELVVSARAAQVEVLTLDVRGDNLGAIALYESEGFREYGRLPGFVAVQDRRWDKVFLALPLDRTWDPMMTDHLVGWVVVRRPDGHVLLARREGVSYGEGRWGLPGGHVGDAESLSAGAARELLEEVDLVVDPGELQPIGVTRYVDGSMRGTDFFFLARSWRGEPRPASECSQVGWFDPLDLPADALPWLARSLRVHLVDGRWLDDAQA